MNDTTDDDNAARPELSVIVPLLDEADSLVELHDRLVKALSGLVDGFEIIFVDDGSKDGSYEILKGLSDRIDLPDGPATVSIIRLRRNFGKATALEVGFRAARGDLLATIDADLQDRPEDLPKLLDCLKAGHDLVCGNRIDRQDSAGKRLASRVFNFVTRHCFGVALHDINCGLKLFKREVAESLSLHGELHRYVPVIAAGNGFVITEIDVGHDARRHGVSKYSRERLWRGFFDLITTLTLTRFSGRPLHLFGGIGVLLSLAGLAICAYLIGGRLLQLWWLGDRPLLLVGVLLTVVGLQFALFGLLADIVIRSRDRDLDKVIRDRLDGPSR